MAALRMVCLPLEVEQAVLHDLSLCKLCSADIENEEHFILHCHALKEERMDLIDAMCKIEGSQFLCLNATDKALLILKLAQSPAVTPRGVPEEGLSRPACSLSPGFPERCARGKLLSVFHHQVSCLFSGTQPSYCLIFN